VRKKWVLTCRKHFFGLWEILILRHSLLCIIFSIRDQNAGKIREKTVFFPEPRKTWKIGEKHRRFREIKKNRIFGKLKNCIYA